MFSLIEKAVLWMAFFRVISGSIEIFAAYLMVKFNQIDKALIITSSLAFIGPDCSCNNDYDWISRHGR
ncbi:hypothetical protein GCM10010978_26970 [Compostibacillus humi]|uniref:Uncharacterized protein n=1 Tax=Compostibacillus humi TaxID=1245525 RepID=A0A8J2TQJ3_9BACI|nr:hypothetical protein GCM10010978_26970 [Compostibacillus humi]